MGELVFRHSWITAHHKQDTGTDADTAPTATEGSIGKKNIYDANKHKKPIASAR